MKKILVILLLIFNLLSVNAQSFEGKITYNNTYKSKNPQVSDAQWTAMMGSTQDYFIKDGNYRSNTNGNMMNWILYIKKDSKLYSKIATSEAIMYNDVSVQGDEVLKSELKKDVTTILGYTCDELILTCKNGTQKYYFNTAIAVDPKQFENHKLGNFYDFISKSKSLPLKSNIETQMFSIESTATSIDKMKLEDTLFQLPAGAKTEKSPF